MKFPFEQLMSQATGLVRSGQLKEATAAIQATLSHGMSKHVAPDMGACDIIDVEARDILAPLTDANERPSPSRTGTATPQEGEFVPGNHREKSGTRAYKLYIPPQHQEDRALPLVVMLHGCTQDPDDFALGTGMNELARQQGFFVLYPAQTQSANSSRCWNWFKHSHQERGRGEPAILAGMTKAVMQQHGIDPHRVYVAGLSAGGAMAAILGQTHPDLFAAVGVHSGLPAGAAKDITSAFAAMKNGAPHLTSAVPALPTIVFHGDRDGTVNPINGEQVAGMGRAAFSRHVTQVREPGRRQSTQHVYMNADGHVVAEHWVVHGAGHAWSGGQAKGSYTDPQGPSATAEMVRFFRTHALSQPA